MICPSCCCCGIYSRLFIVSSCGWCLTSSTYRGRSTDMSSLRVPAVASFREQMKKKKKHGNTSSLLPFRGPVVGGGTFSRLLVAASQIGPEKKVAMSPSSTVHEGQYDISRVSVSWLIRAGGNPPPSQIPLAQSTHFGIIFSPTRNTF